LVFVEKRTAPDELQQDVNDLGPNFLQAALSNETFATPDIQSAGEDHCSLFPQPQAHKFLGALTQKFLEELFLTIAHNRVADLPPVCSLASFSVSGLR
jgi:hypothetical protein